MTRVALHYPLGTRTVTVCQFRRLPITEKVDGFRKVIGRGDWMVAHNLVRVRTVERESPNVRREYFKHPLDGAKAKRAPMVVIKTDTHFQFWDVAQERISFTVTYDKIAAVLDKSVAAGKNSITVAELRAALKLIGS